MNKIRNKNVLVLLPSEQDRLELKKLTPLGYQFIYADDERWRSYEASLEDFDPVEYMQHCIALAREYQVEGIFYTDDLANFVAAILTKELGLPGPPVNAMFLANHKYYSRTVETDAVGFSSYDLHNDGWKSIDTFPIHIKPTSLYFSLLQTTVRDKAELQKVVESLRINIPRWEHPFKKLFANYINRETYPLADKDILLCEEFVTNATQHAVEGWSDEHGHHVWAVSDNNYWPGESAPLNNNSFPTTLPSEKEQALIKVALDLINRFEMKSGFWNIELWIRSDGRIQATEVNGRICSSMTPLYKHIFGKTQYPLALSLAVGGDPNLLAYAKKPKKNVIGGAFSITSTRKGLVSELIDLTMLREISSWHNVIKTKIMYPEDMTVTWHQTGGINCLARAWLVGETYEEICDVAGKIRKLVVKQTEEILRC